MLDRNATCYFFEPVAVSVCNGNNVEEYEDSFKDKFDNDDNRSLQPSFLEELLMGSMSQIAEREDIFISPELIGMFSITKQIVFFLSHKE